MAKVIATINLKGGVGKSTMTAAFAEFMSVEFGLRVLLIDLDPQTSLTTMMIGTERWAELNREGRTVDGLFVSALDASKPEFDVTTAIVHGVSALHGVSTVDLLPSSLDLMETQEEMNAWQYDDPTSLQPLLILRVALAQVREQYDVILIDCPPNAGIVTRNGLMLADGYVIPTIADVLSTYGIPQIQKRVRMFTDHTGHVLKPLGVVITKYRSNSSLHRATIRQLQQAVGDYDALPAQSRNGSERPPDVVPYWVPESNQIAQSAEYTDFGTLRQKYGSDGQFDALRQVT